MILSNVAFPALLRYRNRMNDYGKIVKGVRERKAKSQLMFYDIFVHSVYTTAYAITGNESEAEEIAQDTMLKVFDKTDLLHDNAGDMERILRRIATNAAIDVMRRRKDFIFSVEEIPDLEDSETADDSPYFSLEEIMDAVTNLSDVYRNILTLRLFEDMSFNEIAELLDANYSTVRVQYIRGLTKLKEILIKKYNYV